MFGMLWAPPSSTQGISGFSGISFLTTAFHRIQLSTLAGFLLICWNHSTATAQEATNPTSADVSARVKFPTVRVPMIKKPPVIDGKLEPGEWDGTAAYTGLWQDYGHNQFLNLAYHEKQATFWIAYDDENLYVAQRSPVFPRGAWLKAAAKYRDVLFHPRFGLLWDDHIEFQIRPENNPENRAAFFKWNSNPTDTTVDFFTKGGELDSADFDWDSGFEVKGNWPNNDEWIVEIKIPLNSLRHGAHKDLELPIRDGTVWRHWAVRGIGGTGASRFFSAAAPGDSGGWLLNPVRLEFSSSTVSAQVTELGPLMADGVDFQLSLTNHTDHNETVRVGFFIENDEELIVKAEEDEFLDLMAGETKTVRIQKDKIGTAAAGNSAWVDIRTMGGDLVHRSLLMKFHSAKGMPGYEQNFVEGMQFARPSQQPFYLNWAFYPSKNTVYVEVDTDVFGANEDAKLAVEARAIVLDDEGKEISAINFPLEKPLENTDAKTFGGRSGHGFVNFSEKLPEGTYKLLVLLFDEKQKIVGDYESTQFRQRDFDWIGESKGEGEEDILWGPYTPLAWDGNAKTLNTLKHTFTLGEAGLPSQIQFKNLPAVKDPQLRNPIRLEATKGETRSTFASQTPLTLKKDGVSEKSFTAQGTVGPVQVRTEAAYDADGFLTYDVFYKTETGQAIDTLELVMEFDGPMDLLSYRDRGTFFHQQQVSEVFSREGPVVWNSRDDANTPFELFYGSFLPTILLGNGDRAFLWVCETDRGMKLLEENVASQIEKTEDGKYTLRIFLVNEPGDVSEERHVRFGLMTLPTKPKPENYREIQWNWEPIGIAGLNMHDSSNHYDWHMQNDEDYELFQPKPIADRIYTTGHMVSWLLPELQFLSHNGEFLGSSSNVPTPPTTPEGKEAPITSVHKVTKRPLNTVFHHAMAKWNWSPAMVDSAVHWRSRAIRLGGVEGWWWDHTETLFAPDDHDPVVGNAYELPEHKSHLGGRRQYGFHFFNPRDFFKRISRVIAKDGKQIRSAHYGGVPAAFLEPFLRDHVHWEHAAGYTGATPHMKNWGADSMRLFANNYTGLAGYVIDDTHYDVHGPGSSLYAGSDPINDRSVIGNALLHDKGVSPERRANDFTYTRVRNALENFGYFLPGDAIQFIPYWRNNQAVQFGMGLTIDEWATAEDKALNERLSNVKISRYLNKKDGKVLLIIGNYNGVDVTENLHITPEVLGKTLSKAYDPENNEEIPLMVSNTGQKVPNATMPVHVSPYQFRMIVLE